MHARMLAAIKHPLTVPLVESCQAAGETEALECVCFYVFDGRPSLVFHKLASSEFERR